MKEPFLSVLFLLVQIDESFPIVPLGLLCLGFVLNWKNDPSAGDPGFNVQPPEQRQQQQPQWPPLSSLSEPPMKYEYTTCSQKAYQRGLGQKVVAFTYFKGKKQKVDQEEVRHYLEGIKGNLEAIGQLYGQEWTMRLRSSACL